MYLTLQPELWNEDSQANASSLQVLKSIGSTQKLNLKLSSISLGLGLHQGSEGTPVIHVCLADGGELKNQRQVDIEVWG